MGCSDLARAIERFRLDLPAPDPQLQTDIEAALAALDLAAGRCEGLVNPAAAQGAEAAPALLNQVAQAINDGEKELQRTLTQAGMTLTSSAGS